MNAFDGVEDVQRLADYCRACRLLRVSASFSIGWGLLNLMLTGAFVAQGNFGDFFVILISFLILGQGIWNAIAPSARGVALEGAALLLMVLGDVVKTTLQICGARAGLPLLTGPLAFCVAMHATRWLVKYRSHLAALSIVPDKEDVRRMYKLMESIRGARLQNRPDVLHFKTYKGTKRGVWRVLLGSDSALLVDQTNYFGEIFVLRRSDLEIVPLQRSLVFRCVIASVRVRCWTMEGTISAESYLRYEAWKHVESVSSAQNWEYAINTSS